MSPLIAVGPGAALGKCHNEETFGDFIPVEALAATGELFISKSGHGMGCDELVTWLLTKRAWINPLLSDTAFTPEDIAAIRAWKRPEIKRLAELDDAAAAHVLLARDARRLGDVEAEREHLRQAATLAPDRADLLCGQWQVPPSRGARRAQAGNMGHMGPLPPPARRGWRGLFGRRAGAPLPTVAVAPPAFAPSSASSASHVGVPLAASAGVSRQGVPAASDGVPSPTWEALRRLADALTQDASADLMPSLMALVAWQEHADTLPPDVLARIDAQVRIFGQPFSEQCRSMVDPDHRINGHRCGATDLGHELHKALQACGRAI